jgi:RNA polymerase sigma-70 factor (ECF subfamily)
MASSGAEITCLIAAARCGDMEARESLIAAVYHDLHLLAQRYMRKERPDHTLQPTALVHEAYLRLMGEGGVVYCDRLHFFATAATVMRRILVDYARGRQAAKRVAGAQKVAMQEHFAQITPKYESMLMLDEALNRLAGCDERQARLVELIYFGGLTAEEAAASIGVSVRTAKRDWKTARAWLHAELRRAAA